MIRLKHMFNAHSMKLSDSTKERLAKFKGSNEASTPPTYRRPSVPLSATRSPLRHDYGRGMLSGYHSDTYRTPQNYQGSPYSLGDGAVCSGKSLLPFFSIAMFYDVRKRQFSVQVQVVDL